LLRKASLSAITAIIQKNTSCKLQEEENRRNKLLLPCIETTGVSQPVGDRGELLLSTVITRAPFYFPLKKALDDRRVSYAPFTKFHFEAMLTFIPEISISSDQQMTTADIEQVLRQDQSVRFAAIIGPDGKILKGGMRSETKSLEPASKAEQLYLQWTTMHRSGSDWNRYLGRRRYILDKRERVNIYTFNVDEDHVLLVSTDPLGNSEIGEKILELLMESAIAKKKTTTH